MDQGKSCPNRDLSLDIFPAKKSCNFVFPYVEKPSFLANYDFRTDLSGWVVTPSSNTVERVEFRGRPFAKFSIQAPLSIKYYQAVEATTQKMEIAFDYAMIIGYELPGSIGSLVVTIRLNVGGVMHNLTPSGWSTSSQTPYTMLSPHETEDNVSINTGNIIFNGFPGTGTLIIEFAKGTQSASATPLVSNVLLNVYTSRGLMVEAIIAPKASQSASDIEISFMDSPFNENVDKILY